MVIEEASNTNFIVIDLAQPRLKPLITNGVQFNPDIKATLCKSNNNPHLLRGVFINL